MQDPILDVLNEKQREAVINTDGAILVLAGAGSGKTRVITHRFAYLLREKKLNPFNILAVTFTNKAAFEMKSRISKLVGYDLSNVWIRTFHSMGLMILRQNPEHIYYPKDFVVYDDLDSKALITSILKDLNLSKEKYSPSIILNKISSLKDNAISISEYEKEIFSNFDKIVLEIYKEYEKRLRKSKALDFSDLIFVPLQILRENEKILKKYQNLWQYVMVDEFQDTNISQYELLKLIVDMNKNICVVGDDDQSIYGWRGANIRNIYDFKERYNAKIIPLEQNYRSTPIILETANNVVSKIAGRMQKRLWTENKNNEKIKIFDAQYDKEEAKWIVETIESLIGSYEYKDLAVFYRTNAQSRMIEEELLYKNIPYKIFGGLKFYSRKEIKDILSYIKFIINTDDWSSFERIIDIPKRGIGEITLNKIRRFYEEGIPLAEILQNIGEFIDRVNKNAIKDLKDFSQIIIDLNQNKEEISPANFVKILVEAIGYKDYLLTNEENGEERWENVEELINSIKEYEGTKENPTIVDYISDITLQTVADEIGDENERNYVSLMTIHNAKGLEFPVVFISGVNEGLLPHSSSANSFDEYNEERRLFYVAITRAKEKLFISYSYQRMNYGEVIYSKPSSFLDDIPEKYIENVNRKFKSEILQNKSFTYRQLKNNEAFVVGMQVSHDFFGIGTVTFISDKFYKVNFKNYGVQIISLENIYSLKVVE